MEIELHIPSAQSLKQKRAVIKSLKDRVTAKFNVSIAEVDFTDKWQRSILALAIVSRDKTHLESQFTQVMSFVDSELLGSAVVLRQEMTLF